MAIRLAVCMLLGVSNLVSAQGAPTADRDGAARTIQAYRDAWLANDRARVMATLTSDAALGLER